MTFEYLDFENKLYIPTQTLITQIHYNLINLYGFIRQLLIDAHYRISTLSVDWYEQPIEMSVLWHQQSVIYTADLYSKMLDELLPQTEATYTEMLAIANNFGINTMDRVTHFIDNPEQISTEAIESMTETFSMASDISSELVSELQNKSTEIISLLLEQPMQTVESAYMELLSSLLEWIFPVDYEYSGKYITDIEN